MPESARNRPDALRNDPEREAERRAAHATAIQALLRATEKAMSPEEVVQRVFDAIREEKLYILTHDWVKQALADRVRHILDGRNPDARNRVVGELPGLSVKKGRPAVFGPPSGRRSRSLR